SAAAPRRRARRPRSPPAWSGPCSGTPPRRSRPARSRSRGPRGSWRGRLREETIDRGLEDVVGDGAHVLEADLAAAVDEERFGHAVDAVVDRDRAFEVLGNREGQAEVADELQRGLALVLDVHTDHHHATLAIAAPVALEHRRLLVARRIAPRRPEVH